mgnify:CR=1 FL=1
MSISKRIKDQIEALDVNRNMKDLMLDILEAQSRGSKKLMIKRFRSIWISRIKKEERRDGHSDRSTVICKLSPVWDV